MLPVLAKADVIDVSDDHGGLGYHRDLSRSAPDNLFASPTVLLERAGNPAKAVDVGFTFDDAVPAGGHPGVEGDRVLPGDQGAASPGTPPPVAGSPR